MRSVRPERSVSRFALLAVLATIASCGLAFADEPALCRGCVLESAGGTTPAPLVVLLHGDNESASARAAMWLKPLKARGFAMLSVACPKDRGCPDSFWRWDGDPRWLFAQVEAAARRIAIDRSRIFLIGWSGGASYMGFRADAWSPLFAALVFHGGGMAPPLDAAGRPLHCDSAPPPALFLVGDKNPLHHLALALRKSLLACHHDVTWRLLAGADHDGERAALRHPETVTALLDWLAVHRRNAAAAPVAN